MNYPVFLTAFAILLFLFSIAFFWLKKLDTKLKNLHSDYQKALHSQDVQRAKEAGKKYYSSILFGLAPQDERMIDTEIRNAKFVH